MNSHLESNLSRNLKIFQHAFVEIPLIWSSYLMYHIETLFEMNWWHTVIKLSLFFY